MRELVYLSQSKLQQFRKPASKKDGLSGGVKVTSGLTGLPTVESELAYDPARAAAGATANLDEAEKFIRSTYPVRWWTEEQTPGEWIQFETLLIFGVLEARGGRAALLFWGRDQAGDAGSPQLLLHGSAQHLLPGSGETAPVSYISPSYVGGLFTLFEELDAGADLGTDLGHGSIDRVIRRLRGLAPDFTASWMSGMARTSFEMTIGGRRIVVASPLVVERIPAP
jgi:hypothetical protein